LVDAVFTKLIGAWNTKPTLAVLPASPALLLKINAGLSWQLLHCRAVSGGIGS